MTIGINNVSNNYNNAALFSEYYNSGKMQNTEQGKSIENTEKTSKTGKTECQTCKERKYQDVSNDPSVSFKTPAKISAGASASVVISHEQEHVRNEAANASKNGREVVSQSVRLESSVCPECGKFYVSGGTTTTVTRSKGEAQSKDYFLTNYNNVVAQNFGFLFDKRV